MQAALGHEGEQADGLDGHRLSAGIGAGDYQGVEVLPQHQVVGHRPVRIQQGVAGLPQVQAALHDSGGAGPHPVGQLGPGEDHIQKDEQIVVLSDIVLELCALGGQLRKDALNLLLLPGLELLEFVVGLHHPHGLDEEGGPGGGHVVHQAGHVVLVLRLDGHHEAVVALGDDGLLEIFGLVGGEELVEDVPHLGGGGPDVPPDGGQLGAPSPYSLAERAARSTAAMSSSSRVLSAPPMWARWREAATGLTPEKEGLPRRALMSTAALVSSSARWTSSGSVMGRSARQRSLPSWVTAWPARRSSTLGSSRI